MQRNEHSSDANMQVGSYCCMQASPDISTACTPCTSRSSLSPRTYRLLVAGPHNSRYATGQRRQKSAGWLADVPSRALSAPVNQAIHYDATVTNVAESQAPCNSHQLHAWGSIVSAASCGSSWDRGIEASAKASGVAIDHLQCTADQSSCIPMTRKAFEPHDVRPGDMVGNPQDYLLSVQLYVLEL